MVVVVVVCENICRANTIKLEVPAVVTSRTIKYYGEISHSTGMYLQLEKGFCQEVIGTVR